MRVDTESIIQGTTFWAKKIWAILVDLCTGFTPVTIALAIISLIYWSWKTTFVFGASLMFLLTAHEFGHLWGAKLCGIREYRGPYFIPPFGALIFIDKQDIPPSQAAFISYMGPCWGGAASLIFLALYFLTGVPVFAVIALLNAYINLFNLIPLAVLDGANIVRSIILPAYPRLGIAMLAGACLAIFSLLGINFLSLLFVALYGFSIWKDIKENWHRILGLTSPTSREKNVGTFYLAAYFSLIIVLCLVIFFASRAPGFTQALNLLLGRAG